MPAGAVLEKVDSLPGAKAEPAVINWYGQVGLSEHGSHVGGGVIISF